MSNTDINVEPGVGIFEVIRHLSYKPQYALAEYIDNSISSFENNKIELRRLNPGYKLRVIIQFSKNEIRVKDNAAGISKNDYARAFKPAAIPPDRTGLNEFGMGMKTASIWLSRHWQVVTNAINDHQTGIVDFDVDGIIASKRATLTPKFQDKVRRNDHGTEIILTKLNHELNGQVIRRVKEHLSDIYRKYLKNDEVEISIESESGSEPLIAYKESEALVAKPAYNGAPAGDHKWEREINLLLSSGRSITGKAKVLAKGDTRKAGLYLFRRNRLIVSAADPFRPYEIYGQGNSYPSQRLFIELDMKGFEVTHTKDEFVWGAGGDEKSDIIKKIKEALQEGAFKLITQASEYRVRGNERTEEKMKQAFVEKTDGVLDELDKNKDKLGEVDEVMNPPSIYTKPMVASQLFADTDKVITINGVDWLFNVSAARGDRGGRVFSHTYDDLGEKGHKCVIKINVDNAFSANLLNENLNNFDLLARIAIATAFAHAQSVKANRASGLLVTNINRMLTDFLSGTK